MIINGYPWQVNIEEYYNSYEEVNPIKPIIITMSGKADLGKDTAARFIKEALEEKGFEVLELAYADYLKAIVNRNFVYETEEV